MKETTKLHDYRIKNGYSDYFRGKGIDIGCGDDCLNPSMFGGIVSVQPYDALTGGDANTCADLRDNQFDFVYSSHCLEHMRNPYTAIRNWIRICKPGGYLIICVPHEIFYEKCKWPSMFNGDHKTSWTLEWKSDLPQSIHTPEFLGEIADSGLVKVIRCCTILSGFSFRHFYADQTLNDSICQIEFVLQKLESGHVTQQDV